MEKTRIQIIGDSLALHREKEGIQLEDTYPYLLNVIYEVTNSSGYGKSTNDNFMVFSEHEFVIIHLGLVDCFPRLYSNRVKGMLNHLHPRLRKIVTFIFSHYRFYFTRMFQKVNTNRIDFEQNMINILSEIKKSGAIPIIVDIVHVSKEAADRNYGANDNIEKYNDTLCKISFQYDCPRVRLNYMTKHHPEMLHKDGQHLSKIGHRVMAHLIYDTIEEYKWQTKQITMI